MLPHTRYYNFCHPRQAQSLKTNVLLIELVETHHTTASNNLPPNSVIAASPRRPRRECDVESFHSTNLFVVETVQSTADQVPDEKNISTVVGDVSSLIREVEL